MKIIHQRYRYPFIDIGIGQSHLSRNNFGAFIGGTPVNSHELSVTSLYFALNNIVLPDITAQHPDWSYEDRREEAIRRIELRSADNLRKGYLPEQDREAVMVTEWDVVETVSGKKMATWNGDTYTTREELWNNFEKYARSRGEWNDALEREKTAQQEMENAVVHGDAKGAATWLSHESNLARYLQVWERENDGHIVSRQYDVGIIVGRDIGQQEADRVMNNIGKLYGEKASSKTTAYPHVISKEAIHIRNVSLTEGQKVVFTQEFQVLHTGSEMSRLKQEPSEYETHIKINKPYHADDGVYPQVTSSSFVGDIGGRVINDTREIVRQVSKLFTDELKLQNAKGRVFGLPVVRDVRRLFEKKNIGDRRSEVNAERLTITKIREKPVRIGEVIQKLHQEMRHSIRSLAIVADTRVGIAAIPLLIDSLAKELPKPLKAVEKSIGRHERRMRRIKKEELQIMGKKKENKRVHSGLFFEHRSGEVMSKELKEKKKRHKVNERRVRNISDMKRITERRTMKSKKRKRIQLTELVRRKEHKFHTTKKKEQPEISRSGSVRRIDILLQKTLMRLAKKIHTVEIQKKNKVRKNEKNKTFQYKTERVTKQKKEETVALFSFAWVVWILLARNDGETRKSVFIRPRLASQGEALQNQNQEYTPWILLSIIWYLTMIREKKVHSVRSTAFRKKKKSKFKSNTFTLTGWQLPNQAIIFAFGS